MILHNKRTTGIVRTERAAALKVMYSDLLYMHSVADLEISGTVAQLLSFIRSGYVENKLRSCTDGEN